MFKKKESKSAKVMLHTVLQDGLSVVCLNDVIAFLYERGRKDLAEEVRDRCVPALMAMQASSTSEWTVNQKL